jgi:hypothetical protein
MPFVTIKVGRRQGGVGEASRTSFTVAGASQDRQKPKTGAGRFAYIAFSIL